MDIEAEDEELYRRAEKAVNEQLRLYANSFEKIGREVLLSIVAYEVMLDNLKTNDEIKRLEKEINSVLNREV
ncbi:MAG: cell division protein ZapA [Paludibacteraceae bacterium]|nr:cell division protein ZapA [Paludibacteraceae bacterium]